MLFCQPWQLYRTVFRELLARCQRAVLARRKLRFKNKLVSLDSTVIDLCATLFDWAQFRRTKGAVKLHGLLDHDGYLPSVVVVTAGKRHDVRVARTLRFAPGPTTARRLPGGSPPGPAGLEAEPDEDGQRRRCPRG